MAIQPTQAGAQIEPRDGLSYVRGSTDIPLSDATVSRFFLGTVAQFPDRPAVTFREQNIRWTWREFADEVDVLAAGLLALGVEAGDRVGIWSPNRVRMAADAVRDRAHRRDPRQHQSGLSAGRTRIRVEQGRLQGADRGGAVQDLEVSGDAAGARAGTCGSPSPAHSTQRGSRDLQHVIRMGDAQTPGMLNFGDVMARGREHSDTAQRSTRSKRTLDCSRSDQHPVHQRHDRQPEGRDAHASQRRQQRALHRAGDAPRPSRTRCASRCRCITASAWCWRCSRACRRARRWFSRAKSSIPPRRSRAVDEERCTALHGVPTMFIAELDHPHFAKYDSEPLRTGIMAGSPCPIETMKRVVVADAHARNHDRLRHDRDQPGVVPELDRPTRSTSARRRSAGFSRIWR